LRGKKTVDDRVQEYGAAARSRLAPHFQKAGVPYPPKKIVLVGLKEEKRLEVYAKAFDEQMNFVCAYPILAASGHAGPKLREGDFQVPEGFYRIESLNPSSAFHLALRVNYPNEFDRENAAHEGRENLGSDIMIHGSNASVGCLAMGDAVAEELFVLAADAGRENVEVLLCPADFRVRRVLPPSGAPPWTTGLYQRLAASMRALPRGESAQ
jgi:murein L,D-transpeptidase YafK